MTIIDITGNGSGADALSVNTGEGTNNVRVNGVAGVLQVLVDGTPV